MLLYSRIFTASYSFCKCMKKKLATNLFYRKLLLEFILSNFELAVNSCSNCMPRRGYILFFYNYTGLFICYVIVVLLKKLKKI